MSAGAILRLGYGAGGSAAHILRLGYGTGEPTIAEISGGYRRWLLQQQQLEVEHISIRVSGGGRVRFVWYKDSEQDREDEVLLMLTSV